MEANITQAGGSEEEVSKDVSFDMTLFSDFVCLLSYCA